MRHRDAEEIPGSLSTSRAYPSEIAVSSPMVKRRHKASPPLGLGQLPSVSIAAIFSFLKDTRGVLTWTLRDLQECLNVEPKDAMRIVAILEMQGYVRRRVKRETVEQGLIRRRNYGIDLKYSGQRYVCSQDV
jgi:hypothetical protein